MTKLWDIKLYGIKKGFKVVIIDETGRRVESTAPTPQQAYNWATNQLVVKPWLVNWEEEK